MRLLIAIFLVLGVPAVLLFLFGAFGVFFPNATPVVATLFVVGVMVWAVYYILEI